jgi:hypothetical protein
MMLPPDPGSSLPLYLKALGETLSIALLGTTVAALMALPVSLLAARNIVPEVMRFPVRRLLDSIRGVDTLIWALVWINVVGLGPFAGVLAIAVSDFGAFGKLFSEAIEAADRKQVEGIRASGGSALHEIRFGLMPQVLPVIAGQVLYFIESNTRSGDDHRYRRRGRHRFAARGTDPRTGMAEGIVPDPDDPGRRRGNRLDFEQAALCHHRPSGGGITFSRSRPGTRRARPRNARAWSSGACPRYRRRWRRPPAPGARAADRDG